MDLKIVILDEDGEILENFRVYQEGSDAHGAAMIASLIEEHFQVEDD